MTEIEKLEKILTQTTQRKMQLQATLYLVQQQENTLAGIINELKKPIGITDDNNKS